MPALSPPPARRASCALRRLFFALTPPPALHRQLVDWRAFPLKKENPCNSSLPDSYSAINVKRFLADVVTPDGEALTVHCANTGAMTGGAIPGDTVWYSTSDNRKRRYPHSCELTETASGQWIRINTLRDNVLVGEALPAKTILEVKCDMAQRTAG